ncbi:MAG: HNH endonuclease [Albidovulum sp.]|nr:HNH endonuclease [Albidovulum sp.]MDE0533412.1 HNH endonuclease [Albidovulum sp.]
MTSDDLDSRIRYAAIGHIQKFQANRQQLSWSEIANGFVFRGRKLFFATQARGIFKPKQMKSLLSIKTVIPKPGRKSWYDDQQSVHESLFSSDESVEYEFMKGSAESRENQLLRDACDRQLPIIYFLGVAPSQYIAHAPVFIGNWSAENRSVQISFGLENLGDLTHPKSESERKYALRQVKQRLHQTYFRAKLLRAYGNCCALSRLKEIRLLDAAHIVRDSDPEFGQATVKNGLLLSKIHHAAFDANLIGIDPDFRIHISGKLLSQSDGPILEALKQLKGKSLQLPADRQNYPDRDRLEIRFGEFRSAVQD